MVQLKELVAMMLIGDAVLGLVTPERHVRRWEVGPPLWRRGARVLVDRPELTRVLAAVELTLAISWVRRLPARPS